jgi:hypothetical protein
VNVEEFISKSCRLGRSDPAAALNYISQHMNTAAAEISSLSPEHTISSGNITRILETIRVSILFTSGLLIYQGESLSGGKVNSETKLIPAFILDACLFAEAPAAIVSVVGALATLLQQQIRLSMARNGFFSPLIVQNLMHFFAEYISIYVDPDVSNYDEQSIRALSLHGVEFNEVISLLCQACQYCLVTLPLEEDLVLSCAALIQTAFANAHGRIGFIVSQQAILEIFSYAARTTDELGLSTCRLSPAGLIALVDALACLSSNEGSLQLFAQLCSAAQARLGQLSASLSVDASILSRAEVRKEILYCISTLSGIARSPIGCEKQALYQTYNRGLPLLSLCVQNCLDCDDIITAFLSLLNDYAECQLNGLPPFPSLTLYR